MALGLGDALAVGLGEEVGFADAAARGRAASCRAADDRLWPPEVAPGAPIAAAEELGVGLTLADELALADGLGDAEGLGEPEALGVGVGTGAARDRIGRLEQHLTEPQLSCGADQLDDLGTTLARHRHGNNVAALLLDHRAGEAGR